MVVCRSDDVRDLSTHCHTRVEHNPNVSVSGRKRKGLRHISRDHKCDIKMLYLVLWLIPWDEPYTGRHNTIFRTVRKTRCGYFWRELFKDIRKWIKSCTSWNQWNGPVNPVDAHLQPIPVTEPLQRLSTDILVPLPVCKNTGNVYFLVLLNSLQF